MVDLKPSNLNDTLDITYRNLYPNIATILLILLTMPASTAVQHDETNKNILTTYNDNWMLSALATFHAYRDVEIDWQTVISKNSNEKSRKLDFEWSDHALHFEKIVGS